METFYTTQVPSSLNESKNSSEPTRLNEQPGDSGSDKDAGEARMIFKCIEFTGKFSLFDECWSPKCVARVDNYLVKLVKIKGNFTWHSHAECDEVFIVHKGNMRIDFRDGFVDLAKGEMFVVPKGKEHKPISEEICEIILFEREDVLNTGDVRNEFTKEKIEWI